jgi:hypothetical protein
MSAFFGQQQEQEFAALWLSEACRPYSQDIKCNCLHDRVKMNACRVARWYIFKPKIQIWVNFGVSCNDRCWYILWPSGIHFGHWVYF